jgi:hypothetical protein
MSTNEFIPFCPTDNGTNLLDEAAYTASADRVSGNKPGVASAKLNNKALRQGNAMASQLAQFISNQSGTDLLDDAVYTKLLAQITSVLTPLAPIVRNYLSGSGTHNASYIFFIATGSATTGATYTNNSVTYTVSKTVASGLQLIATGSGAPTPSGTLTKSGGTGDATLTFYAVRAPLALELRMVGGGGGGGGSASGSAGGTGGTGGTTTFGSSLLSCAGGTGGGSGAAAGSGGSASLGTGPTGMAMTGGYGQPTSADSATVGNSGGGNGASTPFGGAGGGSFPGSVAGLAAIANSGSGGGGAGGNGTLQFRGSGGGAGGFVDAFITSPLSTYAYAVGTGGTAGAAGTSGFTGGPGGSGSIQVIEMFQ